MVSIKKNNQVRQAEREQIRRLLNDLWTDAEIIKELRLTEPTYYRYKRIIVQEDKPKLEQLKKEMFEHSMLMANKGLDYIIEINRKICEDPKTSAFNKRESSIVVAKAYRAKAELLEVGPTNNAIRLMPRQVVGLGGNAALLDSTTTIDSIDSTIDEGKQEKEEDNE